MSCVASMSCQHTYAIILVFKNTNNFIQRMLKCMRVIFRLPKLLLKRLDEKDESEMSPAKDTKKKLRPILSSLNMNPLEWIKMAITYISSNFYCTLFMKRSCCCYWKSYILFRFICFFPIMYTCNLCVLATN